MISRKRQLAAVTCMLVVAAMASAQVVDIKAYGRPKNAGKMKGAHYAVWFDEEGWHVRTGAGEKFQEFEGTIEVADGKITRVMNFESLEVAGKKKKKKGKGGSDLGRVTDNRITFRFRSAEYGDSFGFLLSDTATKVRFRLLINGEALPNRVFVGEGAQPAPGGTFELPAHPSR
jgi:hypothetical protein